jgi:hypothetical protein
MTNYAG